jgi:hypothetical protein
MKAIDKIESANKYYLLSKVHGSKPIFMGNRIELEFALQKLKSDMIIATTGDNKGKKCIVIIDLLPDEIKALKYRSQAMILKLKELKAKN